MKCFSWWSSCSKNDKLRLRVARPEKQNRRMKFIGVSVLTLAASLLLGPVGFK